MTTPPGPFSGTPPTATPPVPSTAPVGPTGSPYWLCMLRAYHEGRRAFLSMRNDGMSAVDFKPDPQATRLFEALTDYCSKHNDGLPSAHSLEGAWGLDIPDTVPGEPLPFWLEIIRKIKGQSILLDAMAEVEELTSQGKIDAADGVLSQAREALRSTWERSLRPRPLWELRAEVARKYEAAKRGEVGVPFPWPTLNRFTRGAHPEDLILFVARTGVGKCLAGDQIVYDAATGLPQTAQAAYQRKIGSIPSWSAQGGIAPAQVAAWKNSGTKHVLEITLDSGRTLKVTPEHKLLTPDGWREAHTVAAGHTLALPVQHPLPTAPVSLDGLALDLLAYACWSRTPWTPQGLEALRRTEGGAGIFAHLADKWPAAAAGQDLLEHLNERSIAYYREAGGSTTVAEKARYIPAVAFQLNEACLARYLGRLWALGGTVRAQVGDAAGLRGSYVVYGTTCLRFAQELQHLLLRLGVHSRVTAPKGQDPRDALARGYAYRVSVGASSWGQFRRRVAPYLRASQAQALSSIVAARKGLSNTYGNPYISDLRPLHEAWKSLKAEQLLEIQRRYEAEFGGKPYREAWGQCVVWASGDGGRVRAAKLRLLLDALQDPALDERYRWVVDGTLRWDRVVSVVARLEPEPCYDFTVPETHCFLAGDVVIHNSWALVLWAIHAAREGCRVLLVTTELAQETVASRGMGMALHLPYERLRQGTLSPTDEARMYAFVDDPDVAQVPLYVYGGDFSLNLESLEGAIEDTNPELVLVDGIYLFKSALGVKQKSRTDQVTENFNYIKQLAKKKRVAMGVSTQLNRDAAKSKTSGGGAQMHNISLTDAAGWNSDLAFALEQSQDQADDGEMEITCMKGREMRKIPKIRANWKMDVMDFTEIATTGMGQAADWGADPTTSGVDMGDDADVPF
jgi:intein/homing endonuclease